MITEPMEINEHFPVRKTGKQKAAFRSAVMSYCKELGYDVAEEKGSFGSRNIVIGNPSRAKYLITAHYDTCANMLFPNLITPCNFWIYLLYQIVVVGFLWVASLAMAFGCGYALGDIKIAIPAWYVFYWLLLIIMLMGPANRNNANDNTSGVVTVLEIARELSPQEREKVAFVLFDLEEAGLLGSSSYRKEHKKETEKQIILNLDCVGDGNEIVFFPTKKLRADANAMAALRSGTGKWGSKTVSVREKGFSVYPSDQRNFPKGVGIAALHKTRRGLLYLSRIHTKRDTVLEKENVTILRQALTAIINAEE